jgi:hypothetical protein
MSELIKIKKVQRIHVIPTNQMSELNKTATALLAELLIQNKQRFDTIDQSVGEIINQIRGDKPNAPVDDDKKDRQIEALKLENSQLKHIIQNEKKTTRLDRFLTGNLSDQEIKAEYQEELKHLELLFKKYDYDDDKQIFISNNLIYRKEYHYNFWVSQFDDIQSTINNIEEFLMEYFNLSHVKLASDCANILKLQKYLIKDQDELYYWINLSDEAFDKLLVPLFIYPWIDDEDGQESYELDFKENHSIKFNGSNYVIEFPFAMISSYLEYRNIYRYMGKFTDDFNLNDCDIKFQYDNKNNIKIQISQKMLIDKYIPFIKPDYETLVKILSTQ